MVIFDYTHAFTLQQLELILTQYLQLGPYYQCLKKILQKYLCKFESLPLIQKHNQQKEHPVRLPINCYNFKAKQMGKIDLDTYNGQKYFIYPLTTIIQILNSNDFYLQLPKNIIINGLLTTTNINIIIKTLTIVSEQLSKLIKTTLNSYQQKQLTNYINTLVNDCLQGENQDSLAPADKRKSQKKISFKDFGFLGLLFQKGLNMLAQQQKQQPTTHKQQYPMTQCDIGTIKIDSVMQMSQVQTNQKIQSFNNLPNQTKKRFQRKSSRASIIASILSNKDLSKQQTKNVVRTLKTLFVDQKTYKTVNLIDEEDLEDSDRRRHQLEKQFVKRPKVFVQCEYCRNYRNYLLESTSLSYFDIQQISKISAQTFFVLKRIKNVINAFTLYLKQTNQTTIPANINVINKILSNISLIVTDKIWEDSKLNPKISSKDTSNNKKSYNSKNSSSKKHNLLSQLQPYYKGVYNYQAHSQNQYTIDEILRMCLKASQLKQIQKQLAQKYMFQTRTKKQGKDIETFCITKQILNNKINVPLSTTNKLSLQASNQNTYADSNKIINEIQLLRQYEKQQSIINRAKLNSKPLYTQINPKYQEQITLATAINKHKTINPYYKNVKKTMELSQNSLKQNNKKNQVHQNEKFKILIYQQYMRNQGFNVTKNNMSNIINQNVLKISKSIKGQKQFDDSIIQNQNSFPFESQYFTNNQFSNINSNIPNGPSSNSFSASNLKTQQDNNTDFDKKQTQIYNKMLLNGQTIRNQILNQVEYGDSVIYESYQDFLKKLQQMNAQSNQSQNEENNLNQQNEMLFLTSMGKCNLKKTMSNKKSISRDQSLTNSRKFQCTNLRKTQNLKSNLKNNNLSRTTTNNNLKDKKKMFQDTTNFQISSKKQIKFRKQNFQEHNTINDSFINQYNQNLEIKKPEWLIQFMDCSQNKKNSNQTFNGKTLLENQRFLAFQQKCQLQQILKIDLSRSYNKNTTSIKHTNENSMIQIKNKQQNASPLSKQILKRPFSANPTATNLSKKGTIKSLCKTLSGKKRSFLINKQFVINNNSLLSKMYKQNMGQNVFSDVKRQVQADKSMDLLKFKLQKSKFN